MRTFQIDLYALSLGGGWRLALYDNGVEDSGIVFPAGVAGYCDALEAGEKWVAAAGKLP